MDQHIITTLHVMFLMTGLFACLNAWLGKWGPTVAMLGLSMGSFIAGLAIGGSIFAVIPAMLLVAIICAVRYNKPTENILFFSPNSPEQMFRGVRCVISRPEINPSADE